MRSLTLAVAAMLAAAPAWVAAQSADHVKLTPAQLQSLKVDTVKPQAATAVPLPPAPARVTVPPKAERVVSAPRAGLLLEVDAAEGDRVVKGAVLAIIDSPELVSLQRDFLNANSTAELARVALERDRSLYDDGVIAERRLLQTEQAFKEHQTSLSAARQLLMGAGFGATDLDALAKRQKILTSFAVRSPLSGVILKRLASAGERVTEQQPLFRIADPSVLWIEGSIPADRFRGVAPGAAADVVGCNSTGRVRAVGAGVDVVSQTVLVRVVLDAPCPALRPGQVVQIRVFVPHTEPLLTVPLAAVVRSRDRTWVFARDAGGYRALPVVVVSEAGGRAYISHGLDTKADVAITEVATLKAAWATAGGG